MNIKINEKYIIKRTENNYTKHQYATVNGFYFDSEDNKTYYKFIYGYLCIHQGKCLLENIIELNEQQKIYSLKNEYWKLPQEFYQSMSE